MTLEVSRCGALTVRLLRVGFCCSCKQDTNIAQNHSPLGQVGHSPMGGISVAHGFAML